MRAEIAILLVAAAACSSREPPAHLSGQLQEASVPVLLPREISLDKAHMVTEKSFSALSVPLPGLTVSLHSARIAHRHPGVHAAGAARPMRGVTGYTTVNEGIRTATWIEGGVAHALDLECADPRDARCADDALLLSLVEGLR